MTATLQKCASATARFAANLCHELRPSRILYRCEERAFDRRFRVETKRDRDYGWMARISSPSWQDGQGYAPMPFYDVIAALQQLYIPIEQYTFIDVGCGKGRVLLLAAGFPFRNIIGVEYSPRLCAIARNNLAQYHNPDQRCRSVEVVECDAANFEPPLEPLVLFFHHPFEEPVFLQMVQQLERSLAIRPRPMIVVYFDPRCGHLFESSRFFRRCKLPACFKSTMQVALFKTSRHS